MKHILFIDPLEKLVIKKDSTLLFAHSLKECGHEVYVLFENDLIFENVSNKTLPVHEFESSLYEDSYYLSSFELKTKKEVLLDSETTVHMRLDPPFDSRYLQYLWLLNGLKKKGVRIINDPNGILLNNEKIIAYELEKSIPTFIGQDVNHFKKFVNSLNVSELIFKPLDLYQGIGVEKVQVNSELEERFLRKAHELKGPVVVQPFIKQVEEGEIRSCFFMAKHMGSILKVPQKGEYLANIARGASFHAIDLDADLLKQCEEVCLNLQKVGIQWVAFDILGGRISEVNITCPGLINEVSMAHKKNIAIEMAQLL